MKPPWKSPWKSPWESPNGDPLGVWPCPGYFQWGVHQTEHREVGGDSRRGKLGKPGKGAGAQRSLKKWVKKSPGEWHIIYLSINIYIYHYIYHYIYRDIIIYIYRYIIIYIYTSHQVNGICPQKIWWNHIWTMGFSRWLQQIHRGSDEVNIIQGPHRSWSVFRTWVIWIITWTNNPQIDSKC